MNAPPSATEPTTKRTVGWAVAALATVAAVYLVLHVSPRDQDTVRCGAGFVAAGARCVIASPSAAECPAPLVRTPLGCDAPLTRVSFPATRVLVGPSDWEAEGRVAPRVAVADPFAMDAFELTVGASFCPDCPMADPARFPGDPRSIAQAAALTRDEARTICRARGGRLPQEDEWIVAASANVVDADAASAATRASVTSGDAGLVSSHRYPWGDTGLVCRRAAWGLAHGPCASDGSSADLVGAHPDGMTARGLYDVAGNVAEWVETETDAGAARGGSWSSALASELRAWSRQDAEPLVRDARIGARCAYDVLR